MVILGRSLRRCGRALSSGALAVLFLAAAPARVMQSEIPADLQLALMVKILSFDRRLEQRAGGELRVTVLYQERYPASLAAARDLQRAFASMRIRTIGELPIALELLPLDGRTALGAELRKRRTGLLYLVPLRGADLGQLLSGVAAAQTLTMSGTQGYVERGIAVGLELRGSKPIIRINLAAARAQGADFSSQLLKLAEIVDQ
jgi:hypothetical protein